MAGFNTSQDAMAAGAAHVDNAVQQVNGHIGALRGEVESMMGGWSGQAASAFLTLHENFEAQANKINTALRSMHEALGATRTTYGNQEENQASDIQNLIGQING